MDMGMGSGGAGGFVPLNDSGVDFSNQTQAFNFLQEILDDSYFQVVGNQYARYILLIEISCFELISTRYFWYGVVVFIGLATITNLLWKATFQAR